MTTKVDFGVLYGQKTTEDALLIYSSYEDAKASPQTGDFIVLTPKDEGNTKFLARVEAEIYDEDPIFKSQDKTLIAVHYARIAERELSERDKQKMFSYTYKVRILGTFTDNGTKIEFTTAVRKLPTVSYIARHLNKREIEYILHPKQEVYFEKVKRYIAKSDEIDIQKIKPYLILVDQSEEHKRIWSYATGFWSIPVTTGYGRRLRYFVFDEQNDKLIGIVGLADPVIGLETRDVKSIGWSKDQKLERLYNCMTAYILGAIPPYNRILGGKLVALTVMFPEVRKWFYDKYKNSKSIITDVQKKPYLVYIDTMGAFGKSSIYNRLLDWDFIGYTKGQSHIHITANGSWELIKKVVSPEEFNTYKYGQGPNWKMRILRKGLHELGLSEEMMSIGWQRGYYRCTLAENWQEYLRGETNRVKWKNLEKDELVDYWKIRWVIPRLSKLQMNLLKPESSSNSE